MSSFEPNLFETNSKKMNEADKQNKAKYYLDKVKMRFAGDPTVFQQFIEILRKFKQNLYMSVFYLHEHRMAVTEVISKVKALFKDQDDLLQDFSLFLPPNSNLSQDMNVANMAGAFMNKVKDVLVIDSPKYKSFLELVDQYQKRDKAYIDAKLALIFDGHPELIDEFYKFVNSTQGQKPKKSQIRPPLIQPLQSTQIQPIHPPQQQQNIIKPAAMEEESMSDIDGDSITPKNDEMDDDYDLQSEFMLTVSERSIFERAKYALGSPEVYKEFLKVLSLFSDKIITDTEFYSLVRNLLPSSSKVHDSIYYSIKLLLVGYGISPPPDDHHYSEIIPIASYVRGDTPSYRKTPDSFPTLSAFVKDYRNDSVTNDRWISLPEMLGDDYQFKPARQTSYHYELFKCEDDMYEIDIILGHHRSCIKELTRLYEEANAIKSLNYGDDCQYHISRDSINAIHIKALNRLYGDSTQDILEALYKHPYEVLPILINSLNKKEKEWLSLKEQFDIKLRGVMRENYYRSLDFVGYFNKQQDKKSLSAKSLVESIKKLCTAYINKRTEKGTSYITPTLCEDEKPEFIFSFPDPTIHRDLYKLILVLCEKKMSVAEIMKVYSLWNTMIIHLFGLPPNYMNQPNEYTSILKPNTKVRTKYGDGIIVEYEDNMYKDNYKVKLPFGFVICNREDIQDLDLINMKQKEFDNSAMKYKQPNQLNHSLTLYCNMYMYCFFRLYQMLYDRLLQVKECCKNRKVDENSRIEEQVLFKLHDRNSSRLLYEDFLTYLYGLIDESYENQQVVDECRGLFGLECNKIGMFDRLLTQFLKHLKYFSSDEMCLKLRALHYHEYNKESFNITSYQSNVLYLLSELKGDCIRIDFCRENENSYECWTNTRYWYVGTPSHSDSKLYKREGDSALLQPLKSIIKKIENPTLDTDEVSIPYLFRNKREGLKRSAYTLVEDGLQYQKDSYVMGSEDYMVRLKKKRKTE